jgi:hypothetical protein
VAWPGDGHFAGQHIEKLRQLVDIGPAQETVEPGARVVDYRREDCGNK